VIRRADIVTVTPAVRCAVYTRKSTDEGLDQAFNSLDAQREAGEAFVLSRKAEGWTCLPDRYDDGGFSGGNLERPALKRLLIDIEAGGVDAVVCYKVDRLSRSLLDFSRLIEVFDRRKVMFVSVTQPINTADSSGRLMLNVLLSFAQFEREMIADRTRDKMSAARRKGKWIGGHPPLGYRIHEDGGRLVVDSDEAGMLREVFALYLDRRSLISVAEELNRRGWVTKRVGTLGGKPWTKTRVHQVLTNMTCTGRVEHRGQIYPGEHEAILDEATFDRVQGLLVGNGTKGGARAKNRYGHLLRGLLHCKACGCAMSPSVTRRRGKVFRYYVCCNATRRGWASCPHPSLNANQIETAVVERIKVIGRDPSLVAETLAQVRRLQKTRTPALVAERRRQERELARLRDRDGDADHIGKIDARLGEIAEELAVLQTAAVDKHDLARALEMFEEVWACLFPREQERVIALLVGRVEFDAARDTVAVTFRPTGIRALAEEVEVAEGVQA
jgi:site-specific DNA recombinase